jgi:hypothetical protein
MSEKKPLLGKRKHQETSTPVQNRSIPTDTKLIRYRHPSHPHKLFRNMVRHISIFCDNENCGRRLLNNEVTYVCLRCDFDLCAQCFKLPTESSSVSELHDSDNDINEDVYFLPDRCPTRAKTVKVNPYKCEDGEEKEEEEEENEDEEEEEDLDMEDLNMEEDNNDEEEKQVTSISFTNRDYDALTTRNVNDLLSSVSNVNITTIPFSRRITRSTTNNTTPTTTTTTNNTISTTTTNNNTTNR